VAELENKINTTVIYGYGLLLDFVQIIQLFTVKTQKDCTA